MARFLLKVAGSCARRLFTYRQYRVPCLSSCTSTTSLSPFPHCRLIAVQRLSTFSSSYKLTTLNISARSTLMQTGFSCALSSKAGGESEQNQSCGSSSVDGTKTDSNSDSEFDSEATPTEQKNRGTASSSSSPTSMAQPVSDVDVDRELLRYDYEDFELKSDDDTAVAETPKELPISLERGKTGVFDVEELVELLHDENGRDICVMQVPKELDYVDYMVLVNGRSTRHIRAMAEYIRWMYKRKRCDQDSATVKIEGELTNDWFAIDLGNIAVHLFLRNTRRLYDLETLWTVGVEHDEKCRPEAVDIQSSMQREDFSFDVELERMRKLRASAEEDKSGDGAEDGGLKTSRKSSLENAANWHQLPRR